jgi:hypothetical protein
MKNKWTPQDHQNFSDNNILKSRKQPKKRKPPPTPNEWDTQ